MCILERSALSFKLLSELLCQSPGHQPLQRTTGGDAPDPAIWLGERCETCASQSFRDLRDLGLGQTGSCFQQQFQSSDFIQSAASWPWGALRSGLQTLHEHLAVNLDWRLWLPHQHFARDGSLNRLGTSRPQLLSVSSVPGAKAAPMCQPPPFSILGVGVHCESFRVL